MNDSCNNENINDNHDGRNAVSSQHTKDLKELVLHSGSVHEESPLVNLEEVPVSHKTTTPKEEKILEYAEQFRQQFCFLYQDRSPPLLFPYNECGIQKLICTTLRPTLLPYAELYTWTGCACFVADFLSFKPLDPPTEKPKRVVSPWYLLKCREGNSLDYSILLCSLLLGVGYDAYVVCGYATKEVCLMDTSMKNCPYLQDDEVERSEEKRKIEQKYAVKPPKDLNSKYEQMIKERKLQEEHADEEKRRKEEEEEKSSELVKLPPDNLHGFRFHFWVLVLPGNREVSEAFFIEPLLGEVRALDDARYLGLEQVWNNTNIWINMQPCYESCKGIFYELGDCNQWESFIPMKTKPMSVFPGVKGSPPDESFEEDPGIPEVPLSWVYHLNISVEDFQKRFPHGKKVMFYKHAKIEHYAPFMLKDGLIRRLSVYSDLKFTQLTEIREYYTNRLDHIYLRTTNILMENVIEHFNSGRTDSLAEHKYKTYDHGPHSERMMIFYSHSRPDGLKWRQSRQTLLEEAFDEREDFLEHRTTEFGAKEKKFGPVEDSRRTVVKVIERFRRNENLEADADVETRTFNIAENHIYVKFHRDKNFITGSFLEFFKPSEEDDKGQGFTLKPDMWNSYKADYRAVPFTHLELYLKFSQLMEEEKQVVAKIRQSEDEVIAILNDRTQEEAHSELYASVYNVLKNEKALKRRQYLQKEAVKSQPQEVVVDLLGPYLAQKGLSGQLTKQEAQKIQQKCLQDFRQRLVNTANAIQSLFDQKMVEIEKQHHWYQDHQMSLTKEEEEKHRTFINETMFQLHVLELRLNRHKEMAPLRYQAVEKKLGSDPRLTDVI
ncbi:dynein regulatory complex subunit 7-like isoform X1 [Limulus polyphemus]|uniref:Dynein regulatory complex subunit 7-like isoform X1 n=1 Tax=Limulus polyphemus TaxID=6850 RepID=A0ABM1SM18_LIMPO|nr:dynein regulatory complex subunit 7-like isoform X1 [Limulus polyphemus]XP_022244674.1 dynein regulatory complex subunit 7-like isoform X1 [Limulus polyphemus]XP_022244681.1 dynein regulatory complex subunit 7-like isoform X1 [Limulus polyphemus]XP_022244685.1 dynein regulatory complex subunit 7-like isoform X1 [Limulus polyphemus]